MDSFVHEIRVLWVGGDVPAAMCSNLYENGHLEMNFEACPDILSALGRVEKETWTATIVDADTLPDPPLKWLQHIAGAPGSGELIIRIDQNTPHQQIVTWTSNLRSLRFLLQPLDHAALQALLNQLVLWRRQSESPAHQGAALQATELARLTRQATVDNMTGLLRREEMIRRTDEEIDRARRTGQPLICIMCDIDHFKRVNDVFGHQVGDHTLQRVANLLGRERRSYDLVGRMGGEEFMIVMPGPTIEDGMGIAERLRQSIEQFCWAVESLPDITMSFGIAELHQGKYENFTALSAAADAALYQAKRGGRNQVRCAVEVRAAQPADTGSGTDSASIRLLVVDDTPVYLAELKNLLAPRYRLDATTSPIEALKWAERRAYDLVIADEHMPEMSGHMLLARIQEIHPDTMRILMTSHGDLVSAIQAINEAGVFRYILKPWRDEDLLLTVYLALEHRAMADRLRKSDRQTVKAMAATLELKDRSTQGHYPRVAELCLSMGLRLGYSKERLGMLEYAAWLHDIGKIAVPDGIIRKRTPLTQAEARVLREHPLLGSRLVSSVEHLAPIASFIRHHHERYDGMGYPDGLAGTVIPEEARIISIANAYDGMLIPRGGGRGLSAAAAMEQIILGKGSQFDPVLVELFLGLQHPALAKSDEELRISE